MVSVKSLRDIASILRRDSLEMTTAARSGHPTSCASVAEIMSTLFFKEMSYDIKNANNPNNDEFILSKGHAAPILYSALKRAGCIKSNLKSLRKLSSPLEGHPMPRSLDWIKVATGSLGQGLSVGVGMALAAKLQKRKFRTYVLLGDSEFAEGSVYEALQLASYYKLNNLIAIVDVNRLGQRGETMLGHKVKIYKKRIKSFGWNTIIIDGNNIKQVIRAIGKAKRSNKPTAIIAKTLKGKGILGIEDKEGWHGKALNVNQLKLVLDNIPDPKMPQIKIKKPKNKKFNIKKNKIKFTKYSEATSTRKAYGNILASLARSSNNILALDSEVSNSTYANKVQEKTKKQFIECFIAEQNMIGMCLGLEKKGFEVYGSTFAAFLTRSHDQIRMSALSSPKNMTLCGSHVGVSIGQDGASQMGLEDIAIFRALPNSIVLYPSDAVSAEKLTVLAHKTKGLKYIRTTRGDTPLIYKNSEKFKLGDFKVLKQSKKDVAVLAGSGITLQECLKAYEKSKNPVAVVDIYSVKPFNSSKFRSFVKRHGRNLVVVEDHYKEGGIGEMIKGVLVGTDTKVKHLAVENIPHSGSPEQLIIKNGLDYKTILKNIK